MIARDPLTSARRVLPLVALAVSACASGPRSLQFTPPSGTELAGGEGRKVVVSAPFRGARTEENCAPRVTCPAPPEGWLADQLVAALQAAGVDATTEKNGASPSALQIDGQVGTFFVSVGPYSALGGGYYLNLTNQVDIQVELVARTATGLEARRRFYVRQSERGRYFSTASSNANLAAATGRIVRDMTVAILNLMNEFPDVGRPGLASERGAAPQPAGAER